MALFAEVLMACLCDKSRRVEVLLPSEGIPALPSLLCNYSEHVKIKKSNVRSNSVVR